MSEEAANFFDDLEGLSNVEESKRQMAELNAKGEHLDHLIHRVFAQSESGPELLEIWLQALVLFPTITLLNLKSITQKVYHVNVINMVILAE